jgi:hypothetical protein
VGSPPAAPGSGATVFSPATESREGGGVAAAGGMESKGEAAGAVGQGGQ